MAAVFLIVFCLKSNMFFSESPRIAETSCHTKSTPFDTWNHSEELLVGKAASWEVNRTTWKYRHVCLITGWSFFPEFSIMEMGPKWDDDPLWRAHIFQVPQPPISFRFFGSPTYLITMNSPFWWVVKQELLETSSILPSLQESKEESLGCHVGEFGRTTSALCWKPGWFQSSSGSSFPI